MPRYRCCILDERDKVASVASVEADDDADALARAASTIRVPPNYPVIEVWLGMESE
jgi:hypothetical protein